MVVYMDKWLREKAEKVREIADSNHPHYGCYDIVPIAVEVFGFSYDTAEYILDYLQLIDEENRRANAKGEHYKLLLHKDQSCDSEDCDSPACYESTDGGVYCIPCVSKRVTEGVS